MQSAPSVAYPVGRFAWPAHCTLLGLALLGVASVCGTAFVWPAERRLGFLPVLGVGWAAWLLAAWRCEVASQAGTLRWDAAAMGQDWTPGAGSWSWQGLGQSAPVPVAALERRLDWGSGMLVCGQTQGRSRWFWLSAKLAEGRWGELRRAIEAQANSG